MVSKSRKKAILRKKQSKYTNHSRYNSSFGKRSQKKQRKYSNRIRFINRIKIGGGDWIKINTKNSLSLEYLYGSRSVAQLKRTYVPPKANALSLEYLYGSRSVGIPNAILPIDLITERVEVLKNCKKHLDEYLQQIGSNYYSHSTFTKFVTEHIENGSKNIFNLIFQMSEEQDYSDIQKSILEGRLINNPTITYPQLFEYIIAGFTVEQLLAAEVRVEGRINPIITINEIFDYSLPNTSAFAPNVDAITKNNKILAIKKNLQKYYSFITEETLRQLGIPDNIVIWEQNHYDTIKQFIKNTFIKNLEMYGGFTAEKLLRSGFSKSDLTANGINFTLHDLKNSGASFDSLLKDGFSLKELKDVGFTADNFKNNGLTLRELLDMGLTAEQFKGISLKLTKNDFSDNIRYTSDELKNIGITAKRIYDVMTIDEMILRRSNQEIDNETEAIIKKIINYGFILDDLRWNGFTKNFNMLNLKNTGFSASDLVEAGFTPNDFADLLAHRPILEMTSSDAIPFWGFFQGATTERANILDGFKKKLADSKEPVVLAKKLEERGYTLENIITTMPITGRNAGREIRNNILLELYSIGYDMLDPKYNLSHIFKTGLYWYWQIKQVMDEIKKTSKDSLVLKRLEETRKLISKLKDEIKDGKPMCSRDWMKRADPNCLYRP